MYCAVLGSSLTITVGVKIIFERQKHADAGESKHDATASLGRCSNGNCRDGKIGTDARQLRPCCANPAKVRLGNPYLFDHGSWIV
jgi:hypothetical protein